MPAQQPAEVFISYRRSQSARVLPAVAALEAAGVRCFLDQQEIDPLDAFPQRLTDTIAASLALLVWWSEDYAESDHCLAEFRLAWQHTRRQTSNLNERLWIINPLPTVAHICAGELGAQNFLVAPQPGAEAAWAQQTAANLVPRLAALRSLGTFAGEKNAVAPGALYGVPEVSPHFTGRNAALMHIHGMLHPARIGVQPQGVAVQTHGLAGIGKTELATAYAHAFAQAYPGGVFWLKLAALDSLPSVSTSDGEAAWLTAIDATLRLSPYAALLRDEKDQMLPADAARRRLAALQLPGPALWVLDNVPVVTPVTVRDELLRFWRAPMANAATLITTRDSSSIAGFGAAPLIVMPLDDALRLLARYRKPANAAEQQAAADIVTHTGAHTQALVLLGEHISHSPHGYAALLAELQAAGAIARIEAVAENLRPELGERARGVLAAYAISLRPLDHNARLLLTLAALCLANNALPADVLCGAAGIPSDSGTRALQQLTRSALLAQRQDAPGGIKIVDIHPLTAQAALQLLSGLPGPPNEGRDNNPSLSADEWPRLRQQLAEQLLEKLGDTGDIATHEHSAPYIDQARYFAHMTENGHASRLALRTGRHAHLRGAYALARNDEQRAMALAQTLLGEEHPDTLTSMNNLALTLGAMGELPAARALQEGVLEVYRYMLGEEHPDTLTSMNNLALTLGEMGELPAARIMQERVLEVCRRVQGEEHPDTLNCMNNLASSLWNMGELPAARNMEERVLAVRRRVLGEEHPDTLTSMNNLAETLRAIGELPAARAMHERVLEVHRRVLGEEHPDTLTSMNNLGLTLWAMGELPAARTAHKRVLEVHCHVLGEKHPNTLTSMNNLALTLGAMGELPAARDMHERVLELRRRVLGEEHPDTLTSMNNLAETLRAMGELPAARDMQEQVLDGRLKVLGEVHPDTRASLSTLFLAAQEAKDSAMVSTLLGRYPTLVEKAVQQGKYVQRATVKK